MKMVTRPQHTTWSRLLCLLAIGFGLLTLREGGAVLFIDGAARQAAGDYVPFVLWFNFLAGFAYIAAGVGLWLRRRWAAWLALAIAAATALVFLAFGVHVLLGGAWEQRTAAAMTLRTLVWAGIAAMAWRRSATNAPAAREH
jgi:hypothetical protein